MTICLPLARTDAVACQPKSTETRDGCRRVLWTVQWPWSRLDSQVFVRQVGRRTFSRSGAPIWDPPGPTPGPTRRCAVGRAATARGLPWRRRRRWGRVLRRCRGGLPRRRPRGARWCGGRRAVAVLPDRQSVSGLQSCADQREVCAGGAVGRRPANLGQSLVARRPECRVGLWHVSEEYGAYRVPLGTLPCERLLGGGCRHQTGDAASHRDDRPHGQHDPSLDDIVPTSQRIAPPAPEPRPRLLATIHGSAPPPVVTLSKVAVTGALAPWAEGAMPQARPAPIHG